MGAADEKYNNVRRVREVVEFGWDCRNVVNANDDGANNKNKTKE